MANAWHIFVREYAKKHKISYMCAMSEPDCSKQYIIYKGKKTKNFSDSPTQVMENTLELPEQIANKVIDDFVSFSYLLKGNNELVVSLLNKSEIKLVENLVRNYQKIIDKLTVFFDEPVPQEVYQNSMDTSMDRLETTLGFVLDNPPRLRPDWTEFVTKNYKDLYERVNRLVGHHHTRKKRIN
jgi:hypothetical protein